MKKVFLLTTLIAAFASFAAPRKVALIVQNHCSGGIQPPMSALADTLTASLTDPGLSVVNPANAIGTTQNTLPSGEAMPPVSVIELGNVLGVEGIITVSVLEFTSVSLGYPAPAYKLKTKIAISLANCATGDTVCSVINDEPYGKNYTTEVLKEDNAALFEGFLHESARKCAKQFLAEFAKSEWAPVAVEKIKVFFGCNVLGADVQIDGMSYGTCPAEFTVTPGVHSLKVSYPPYYLDFKRTARFTDDGQTYKVVLQITPEGGVQKVRMLEYQSKLVELKREQLELEKEERALAKADKMDEIELKLKKLEFESKKLDLKKKEKLIESEMSERCELFQKQLDLADAMLKRYSRSGDADDYVRKAIADGTATYWKNSFGRVAITEGNVDNIELATPTTDAGDLAVPPSPTEIGEGLKKLLMKR